MSSVRSPARYVFFLYVMIESFFAIITVSLATFSVYDSKTGNEHSKIDSTAENRRISWRHGDVISRLLVERGAGGS
jgi:hypothetical protein